MWALAPLKKCYLCSNMAFKPSTGLFFATAADTSYKHIPMTLVETLDQLEAAYNENPDEARADVIANLYAIHEAWRGDQEAFNEFVLRVIPRFGAIYTPYVFWEKLRAYFSNENERVYLFEIIKAFANGDFEEAEQQMLKPLLVVYLAHEKAFEIHKLESMIFDKSHRAVREYFEKILAFIHKNEHSPKMYHDKFDLMGDRMPDFELYSLPVTQLRDQLR